MKKNTLLIAILLIASNSFSQKALNFNGTNLYTGGYVSLGNDSSLSAEDFTIECWFKQSALGGTAPTGYGGVYAIPLVTKGRAQAEVDSSTLDVDGDVRDMNYFLGLDLNGILVADFEEISFGTDPGSNHTLYGSTAIQNDIWYHASVTYDGTDFRLYLNGQLESVSNVGRIPNYQSIQYAAIGTAIGSDGFAEGRFNGSIDNVRIWNYARSEQSIKDSMFKEVATAPGLLGSYKLNEGSGTSTSNTGTAGSAGNGSLLSSPTWVAGVDLSRSNSSIRFNGENEYVDFGNSTAIGTATFTLECWFKKTGAGTTGAFGSFTSMYPLLAKGRDEEDGSTKDCNYFLGLLSDGRLAASFEEILTGEKHPIEGVTSIEDGIWYHASATYDGVRWKLYLNGQLENTDSVGRTPQYGSIQNASIGSALNSGGAPEGFFEGFIDNARIWDYARDGQAIVDTMSKELTTAPGLLANWNLNEAYGDTARNTGSAGGVVDGRLHLGAVWADKGIFFKDDLDSFSNSVNDSSWFNPANWLDNEVPYAFNTAFIPVGKKVVLRAGQHAQCDRLINNGTVVIKAGASLSVWGSIVNSGTITNKSGSVTMFGGNSDSIIGNATIFRHLVIDKLSSGKVTITSNVSIDSLLTLNNGIVYTNSANNLTILDNANSSQGSHLSHVDGFMTKVGNDAYVFPLGDNNFWARIGISAPTNTTDAFTANRVHGSASNLSSKQSPLKSVSSYEHWNLNRTVGTSSVRVTLFWEDNAVSNITNTTDSGLVVAHYTGSTWKNETQFSKTGNLNKGSITSQLISSFSPFTFGATSSLSSLPIELLSFNGKKENHAVKLLWATASEINNDHFTIEKSIDGKSWLNIGVVKGALNANQVINYQLYDYNPVMGTQFYRLKQTDLNGMNTYAQIISFNFNVEAIQSVYPNPTSAHLNITLNESEENITSFVLYNTMGQVVMRMDKLEGTSFTFDLSAFENGIYILEIEQDGISSKTKILKY